MICTGSKLHGIDQAFEIEDEMLKFHLERSLVQIRFQLTAVNGRLLTDPCK
jgi:hypothetical protein